MHVESAWKRIYKQNYPWIQKSLEIFVVTSVKILGYSNLCEIEINFQDSVTFNSMGYRLLKPAVKAESWASFSSTDWT